LHAPTEANAGSVILAVTRLRTAICPKDVAAPVDAPPDILGRSIHAPTEISGGSVILAVTRLRTAICPREVTGPVAVTPCIDSPTPILPEEITASDPKEARNCKCAITAPIEVASPVVAALLSRGNSKSSPWDVVAKVTAAPEKAACGGEYAGPLSAVNPDGGE